MKPHHNCPVQATINAISGKWKVQIVWYLSFGTLRFAQLRKKVAGISEKVLTDQLRQLETDGIILRKVTPTRPPTIAYSLSRSGKQLIPIMQNLCDWGSTQYGIQPNLPQPRPAVANSQ